MMFTLLLLSVYCGVVVHLRVVISVVWYDIIVNILVCVMWCSLYYYDIDIDMILILIL